ncbi:hypothetical protein JOB18_008245, partial [Solea senegalensis]
MWCGVQQELKITVVDTFIFCCFHQNRRAYGRGGGGGNRGRAERPLESGIRGVEMEGDSGRTFILGHSSAQGLAGDGMEWAADV